MKKKNIKINPLQEAVKGLLKSFGASEIFEALTAFCPADEEKYLQDEIILFMTIVKKYNIVKTDTLSEQINFENAVTTIIPFLNTQQTNLHLSY